VTEPVPGAGGNLKALQDTAIAALRTAFPALWAALIVWLVAKIPAVDHFRDWLIGPVQALALAAIVYGVRYVFGFIEKRKWVPDWVAVVLLGSAKRPLYVAPVVADAVNDGHAVPVTATKEN
jgi:hypothetical protein